MRNFNYGKIPDRLMSSRIMNLVAAIHEYKGKQDLYIDAKPDILDAMINVAKIQSTGASNRIEGIQTSNKRLDELVKKDAEPINRPEQEIAGYREVLKVIHENYDYMTPRSNIILQMHRDLYQYGPSGLGGKYKNSDNVITEISDMGEEKVRFQPLSASETPDAVKRLTASYIEAIYQEKYDSLILTSMFILDFLCIHPFSDGNGRISRLLTLLLLYRSGYIVGKYISIEAIIEKTKETYYEVLLDSSFNWYKETNDYVPFVTYYLEVILNAYKDFSERVELAYNNPITKQERIRLLFDQSLGKLSKRMILEKCPDISESMVELTLSELVKEGYITKIGAGKSTAYIRNVK